MMEIIFPMQILFVINFFIWIIYIILKYLKHKEIRFKDEIFKGLFIIYITFFNRNYNVSYMHKNK